MTLSLQGYLQLKQNWRDLDLDDQFVDIPLTDQALTGQVIRVGYSLLKQEAFDDALTLIEASQAAGLENVWLSDCRARALFYLQRTAEAQLIWQRLLVCADQALQRSSKQMLSACASRLHRDNQQWIDAQLIDASGDLDACLGLWRQHPDSGAIESAVHNLIRDRLSLERSDWMRLASDQRADLVTLEAEVVWLAAMRSLVTSSGSSATD